MTPAAILGAAASGEIEGARWAFYGTLVVAMCGLIGAVIAGYFGLKAKRNTEPNGGSSPYDALVAEINALTRSVQIVDERSIVEARAAHDVRRRLLDGQEHLAARQDEQAAMIDRLHRRIDGLADHIEAAGAQAVAAVELVKRYHQTGG